MDPAEDKSMFEISLSPEGAGYILRTYRVARIFLVLIIFTSLISLIHGWLEYIKYSNIGTKGNLTLIFQIKVYPFYSTFLTLFVLVQSTIYFYSFRICKRSIESRQSDLFNRSFKWMYISLLLAVVGVGFEFIGSIAYFYLSLKS
jgi:hypothetical protein